MYFYIKIIKNINLYYDKNKNIPIESDSKTLQLGIPENTKENILYFGLKKKVVLMSA